MPWKSVVSSATPSTIAASTTCPRPDRERSTSALEDAHDEEHATTTEVAQQVQRRRGRAVGTAERIEGSRQRHVVDVVPRNLGVRALLAPAGDACVHESGVAVQADVGADAESFRHTRPVPLHQDVGAVDQAERGGDALGTLEVDRDRPPAARRAGRFGGGRAPSARCRSPRRLRPRGPRYGRPGRRRRPGRRGAWRRTGPGRAPAVRRLWIPDSGPGMAFPRTALEWKRKCMFTPMRSPRTRARRARRRPPGHGRGGDPGTGASVAGGGRTAAHRVDLAGRAPPAAAPDRRGDHPAGADDRVDRAGAGRHRDPPATAVPPGHRRQAARRPRRVVRRPALGRRRRRRRVPGGVRGGRRADRGARAPAPTRRSECSARSGAAAGHPPRPVLPARRRGAVAGDAARHRSVARRRPGGPPIVVSGRKEPAMRRAARLGDGWMPYLVSPSAYARSVRTIEEEAARRRPRPRRLRVDAVPVLLGPRATATGPATTWRASSAAPTATSPARCSTASRRPARRKRSRPGLQEYVDAGVRHFVISPAAHRDTLEVITLAAEEVLPRCLRLPRTE